jgi:hypothetical protein
MANSSDPYEEEVNVTWGCQSDIKKPHQSYEITPLEFIASQIF